jgi:hypothetical protein
MIMDDDVADGLLLDIRGIDVAELQTVDEDEESPLAMALHRILESNADSRYSSFNSSI